MAIKKSWGVVTPLITLNPAKQTPAWAVHKAKQKSKRRAKNKAASQHNKRLRARSRGVKPCSPAPTVTTDKGRKLGRINLGVSPFSLAATYRGVPPSLFDVPIQVLGQWGIPL